MFKEGDLLTLSGFLEGNHRCVAHQDKNMFLSVPQHNKQKCSGLYMLLPGYSTKHSSAFSALSWLFCRPVPKTLRLIVLLRKPLWSKYSTVHFSDVNYFKWIFDFFTPMLWNAQSLKTKFHCCSELIVINMNKSDVYVQTCVKLAYCTSSLST